MGQGVRSSNGQTDSCGGTCLNHLSWLPKIHVSTLLLPPPPTQLPNVATPAGFPGSWKVQLWVLSGVVECLSRAEQLTSWADPCTIIRVLLVFKQRGHNLTPVLTSLHQLSTLILDFSKNPSFPQSIFLHLVISVNKSSALIFPVNIKIEKYIQSIQHCLYSLYSDLQCSYT
jgi:hypothetical protein